MRSDVALFCLVLAVVIAGRPLSGSQRAAAPVGSFKIVNVYPHDPRAFTQGLQFVDGVLYEGTGLNGRSEIRKVRLETGEVLQRRAIDSAHFGEGILVLGSRLLQLTWKSHIGFVYDLQTFQPLRTFPYSGEGWGLTYDGARIVMSDGSSTLRFLDPATFKQVGALKVTDRGSSIERLNELEFVRGEIFANIWQTDRIARIDPQTGIVRGWINLAGLLGRADARDADALNGIAYDAKGDRLFVTGKLWPKVFEVRLEPAAR